MTSNRGRPLLALAALAAVLAGGLLTGCDAESKPSKLTLPPSTPSADSPGPSGAVSGAPSPSSTSAATTPTDAERMAAAEQAVRNYITAFNAAVDTGDFSHVHQLYRPECTACAHDVQRGELYVAKHQRVIGTHLIVSDLRTTSPGAANTEVVFGSIHAEPGRVVDSAGSLIRQIAATTPVSVAITLVESNDNWKVIDIMAIPQ